jgi:Tol biopolymer transport system component
MTGVFRDPRFSPQGAGSVLTVSHFNETDRVYDLMQVNLRGNTTYHLTHGLSVLQASWIPGRDELVATTATKGASTISRVLPTEGAPLIPLLQPPADSVATQPQVSRDGLTLMYGKNVGAEGNTKIYVSPVANTGESCRWLDTPAHEYAAHFSPDGRWVAYSTNETDKGSVEVFVRSFSDPREKQQISRGGGYRPVWSPAWKGDGGELFYLTPDGDLMAATIHTSPTLAVDPPERLFRTRLDPGVLLTFHQYDVTPDGQHFVIVEPVSDAPPSINVILNWQALLKR